ncbi:MAG: HD domain-containing phosphohydrolase [Pseudomonadota bacterium]
MTEHAEGKHHPTIRVTVLTFFTLATTLTASLAIGLQYYFGQQQAKESARTLYELAADAVTVEIQALNARNDDLIALLSENPVLVGGSWLEQIPVLASAMDNNPIVHSIYLAKPNGDFYQLIDLEIGADMREAYRASPRDRWVAVTISGTGDARQREYRYLAYDLVERYRRTQNTTYDPRERLWFKGASESDKTFSTPPYLFEQLKEPGRTVARSARDSDIIVAFDITLSSMSEFLQEHTAAQYGELLLYTPDGEIIASSRSPIREQAAPALPSLEFTPEEQQFISEAGTLQASNELDWPPIDYAIAGKPDGYAVDILRMISDMTGLDITFFNGLTWAELDAKFRRGELDILQPAYLSEERAAVSLYSEPFIDLRLALLTREGQARISSLQELNGKRLAIPTGWTILEPTRQGFPGIEIVETDTTLGALRAVLAGDADAALESEVIARYLEHYYYLEGLQYHSEPDTGAVALPTTLHLVVAKDQQALLAVLNRAILAIGPELHEYLQNKWLNFERPMDGAAIGSVPHGDFIAVAERPVLHNELREVEHQGERYFAYGAPIGVDSDAEQIMFGVFASEQSIVGPFMEKVFLSIAITGAFLALLTPLSWFLASPIVRPIKQLANENDKIRRRQYDDVTPVRTRVKELDDLSDSLVEMVAAIKAYEEAQRMLMDSFIQLIAQAIDDKSAYTGGHCERVPELALMLAREASKANLPPFNDFRLGNDDQWREYRIAAWLHDCGKITTPEHIVDKGSKLEVIYNRIHEVRTRFEVLWRDAEIDYLHQLAADPQRKSELMADLERARAALIDDFEFVAGCNVGGEFLDEEKQARLQEIGKRSWQRHFSDRIGLSPVEELRVTGEAPALPAAEVLLNDKPEHIIERTRSTKYPPEYGIDMNIPEHLYNQGELYNLSISRGTLTQEDRFKINEHMISTIKMLESLPFPEELKNVPRYASTHHETMRGDGYPRRLPGAELSIPERILAVADVFEALTASDRPYKKAKPVSIAIDILAKMVDDNHIDRDCFELFLTSGVYREYAESYLDPAQVDEVDIKQYLRAA